MGAVCDADPNAAAGVCHKPPRRSISQKGSSLERQISISLVETESSVKASIVDLQETDLSSKTIRVCILGDSSSGKTTLISKYLHQKEPEDGEKKDRAVYKHSVRTKQGFNIELLDMTDKKEMSEADTDSYNAAVSSADAYVICASATNPNAEVSIRSWHQYIMQVLNTSNSEHSWVGEIKESSLQTSKSQLGKQGEIDPFYRQIFLVLNKSNLKVFNAERVELKDIEQLTSQLDQSEKAFEVAADASDKEGQVKTILNKIVSMAYFNKYDFELK